MANAESQYQDFEPSTEWIEEGGFRTLIVYLPGFKKEQLKVQVTSTGTLKISGERGVAGQKWSRFRHECSIPLDCEINAISAKFQEGMLYVKLPKKIITPQEIEEVKAAAATASTEAQDGHQKPAKEANKADEEHKTEDPHQTNDGKPRERKMKEKKTGSDEKTEEKASHEKIGMMSKVDAGKYKKSAIELVKGLRKPNKVMNLVVAVLLALVLLLYVTNAIRSLGKPKNTIQ